MLDEVEKAHPDIFNTLLQVLDDGRLTDGKGRTVSFKHAVIIMTSNIGSDLILDLGKRRGAIGFAHADEESSLNEEQMKQGLMERLRDQFRPEFLNRIDETVIFHALRREHLTDIVRLQTHAVIKRLQEKKIHLTFSPEAEVLLADKGYDPQFGARPLKRTIQELVLDDLALKIVDGTVQEGARVQIDVENGAIVIRS